MQDRAIKRRLAIAMKRRYKRESPKDGADEGRSQETVSDRSIAKSTRQIATLTGALAAIALVSAIVTGGQWREIRQYYPRGQ